MQPEEVALDVNELAEGREVHVARRLRRRATTATCSRTRRTTPGFRQYTLHVKDLATGELLPERIEKTGSVAWAADSKTLFYTRRGRGQAAVPLYRHRLGDPPAKDALVYEEKDERFDVGVRRSAAAPSSSWQRRATRPREVRFLPADSPDGRLDAHRAARAGPRVRRRPPRRPASTSARTDAGRNFRLVTAPVSTPGPRELEGDRPAPRRRDARGARVFKDSLRSRRSARTASPRFTVTNFDRRGRPTASRSPSRSTPRSPTTNRGVWTRPRSATATSRS